MAERVAVPAIVVGIEPARALHRFDGDVDFQRPDEILQMRRIAHLNVDLEFKVQRIAAGDFQIGDIAPVLADDVGKRRQGTRRILQPDHDPRDRERAHMVLPTQVDPIGHAVLMPVEHLAIDRMDDAARSRHHQSDDPVSRNGMAAGAQAIGDAFGQSRYRDALRVRLDEAAPLACGVALELGVDSLEHLVGAKRAAADIGVNILGPSEAQLAQHALDRLVGELIAFIGEHFFEDLASERDVLAALSVTQIAPDLGARTTGDDEAFP